MNDEQTEQKPNADKPAGVDPLVISDFQCPDCEGSGEVYIGPSSVPDDEPWETCELCGGKGRINPVERIREVLRERQNSVDLYWDLKGKALEKGIEI